MEAAYGSPRHEVGAVTEILKENGMLVLSRKKDGKIIIGDDIVITVVDIRGDKVRLGIDAPDDTPVHREEIYEQIRAGARVSDVQSNAYRPIKKPIDRTKLNGGESCP